MTLVEKKRKKEYHQRGRHRKILRLGGLRFRLGGEKGPPLRIPRSFGKIDVKLLHFLPGSEEDQLHGVCLLPRERQFGDNRPDHGDVALAFAHPENPGLLQSRDLT